jgi:hypothetical protein
MKWRIFFGQTLYQVNVRSPLRSHVHTPRGHACLRFLFSRCTPQTSPLLFFPRIHVAAVSPPTPPDRRLPGHQSTVVAAHHPRRSTASPTVLTSPSPCSPAANSPPPNVVCRRPHTTEKGPSSPVQQRLGSAFAESAVATGHRWRALTDPVGTVGAGPVAAPTGHACPTAIPRSPFADGGEPRVRALTIPRSPSPIFY